MLPPLKWKNYRKPGELSMAVEVNLSWLCRELCMLFARAAVVLVVAFMSAGGSFVFLKAMQPISLGF